jgi:hypothetical protein
MWQVAGSLVDFLHALFMVAWVVGLPLLFWHKRPRLSRAYAIFALTFVALYQGSRLAFGECFLTSLSRWLWQHPSAGGDSLPPVSEWFTVRMARVVFGMAPSERAIVWAGQALTTLTAVGMLGSLRAARRRGRTASS